MEFCCSFIFLGWHHSHRIFLMILEISHISNVIFICILDYSHGFVWPAITSYKVNLLTSSRHILSFSFYSYNHDNISEYLFLPFLLIHCINCLSILKDKKGLLFLSHLDSWCPGMGRGHLPLLHFFYVTCAGAFPCCWLPSSTSAKEMLQLHSISYFSMGQIGSHHSCTHQVAFYPMAGEIRKHCH